jgi:flagellin-specific chaperone FliS
MSGRVSTLVIECYESLLANINLKCDFISSNKGDQTDSIIRLNLQKKLHYERANLIDNVRKVYSINLKFLADLNNEKSHSVSSNINAYDERFLKKIFRP